jgi:hypothetical protein
VLRGHGACLLPAGPLQGLYAYDIARRELRVLVDSRTAHQRRGGSGGTFQYVEVSYGRALSSLRAPPPPPPPPAYLSSPAPPPPREPDPSSGLEGGLPSRGTVDVVCFYGVVGNSTSSAYSGLFVRRI